jgi:alkanesulfonate monooxygenase SsuD/methylene tetrahydromethanopterin reductase-like flavin-dependent oxidoreductase (luciferase family)
VRFGIFYEHQLPRPWAEGDEQRLIGDALEQVELADRVGFDAVWAVEHHFLEEYAHSSASEVFLAACSQRTQRMRLGFGIVALPPGYQHPARVAEKASMLDLVSGGRVELGTGETSSGIELGGFDVDRASKREQWEEALDVVTRMFVEEPFAGWEGRFVSMPPRNVVPKPSQRPHPPLWVACSRRETIRLAAERGIGALSFSFIEPEEAKQWVDEYYEIISSERCVPAGFAVNPNVAVVLPMMCHPDESEAIARGIDGAHFFGYALAHYYVFGEHRPGRTSIWEEFLARRDDVGFARSVITADDSPLGIKVLQQGLGSLRGAIGTPAQVTDLVRRYEAAGVDQVIFVMQAGRNRHEHIIESIELAGSAVLPQFAAQADSVEQAKAQRLAPAIVAALARRAPARESDPTYVVAPGDSGAGPGAAGAGTGARVSADRSSGAADGNSAGTRPAARTRIAASLQRRGEMAFEAGVRRASDRQLERTIGSALGLRTMFSAMARAFVPERSNGFRGEIQYVLRRGAGTSQRWIVAIDGSGARSRPGGASEPRLTLALSVADFVRMAARELDPMAAVIGGRLILTGDLELAGRLGEMFGQPPRF